MRDPAKAKIALSYLRMWRRALQLQRERLLQPGSHPTNQEIDLWFALVALRNALRAVTLAARLSSDSRIDQAILRVTDLTSAKEIRDVFEHFDAYVLGEGQLQKQRREPTTPTIVFDETRETATVWLAEHELDIGEAVQRACDLLLRVERMLGEAADSS